MHLFSYGVAVLKFEPVEKKNNNFVHYNCVCVFLHNKWYTTDKSQCFLYSFWVVKSLFLPKFPLRSLKRPCHIYHSCAKILLASSRALCACTTNWKRQKSEEKKATKTKVKHADREERVFYFVFFSTKVNKTFFWTTKKTTSKPKQCVFFSFFILRNKAANRNWRGFLFFA